MSIFTHYKNALAILARKPFRLWGLTLLNGFLASLALILGGAVPIIALPISLAFEASLSALYLKGLKGAEVDSKDLFTGFKNFKRVAGGMAWMTLWIFLWGLIPIVGPVFAVIKTYAYRFTPYILLNNPEVDAMDAIKVSMRMTQGHKGAMFGADVLWYVAVVIALLILGLFAAIPYVGVLFTIIMVMFVLICLAVGQIFLGLVAADFYKELSASEEPAPTAPAEIPETL